VKARRTHRSNRVFRLPGGTEDNDLWVEECEDDGRPVLSSTWEPTPEEREAIANGANIELLIWGKAQPPVFVGTTTVPLGKSPDSGEPELDLTGITRMTRQAAELAGRNFLGEYNAGGGEYRGPIKVLYTDAGEQVQSVVVEPPKEGEEP
jgi:hypothetical protein